MALDLRRIWHDVDLEALLHPRLVYAMFAVR
jgi:hypothetical protein